MATVGQITFKFDENGNCECDISGKVTPNNTLTLRIVLVKAFSKYSMKLATAFKMPSVDTTQKEVKESPQVQPVLAKKEEGKK